MPNIIDLSSTHILIRVDGEKAETFLQGQLTCDMREVSTNLTRLSAHCNPKGRVLATFRVLKYKNIFYLLSPTDMATYIIKCLTPYARFSKVTLTINEQLGIIGYFSENPAAENIFPQLPEQVDQSIQHHNLLLIRLQSTTPRFLIIGDYHEISSFKETHQRLLTQDLEEWALFDIQAGIATIHSKTSNLFTPHMLNYPALNAVSFKKGCYVGQEVIARTQYLGKTKRTLHHLTISLNDQPKQGDVLHDQMGNEIGIIVNVALNMQINSYEVLAVVQDQRIIQKTYPH